MRLPTFANTADCISFIADAAMRAAPYESSRPTGTSTSSPWDSAAAAQPSFISSIAHLKMMGTCRR
jgi:hypothetical protein